MNGGDRNNFCPDLFGGGIDFDGICDGDLLVGFLPDVFEWGGEKG